MTEPARERRQKKTGKGAVFGVAYAACFIVAVVASAVVIYTGNDVLMRFGFVLALWAALGWAFVADHSRRKAELVSAKASDYKLIYDLQLEREIAARHHYELSLENELRRQLTAEADATTHNVLAELQQQVAVLRGQLQELLDQDLEYDQPALKARATRLDELLVARQSLGTHESQPRKRAAEAVEISHEPQWGAAGGAAASPVNPANGGEQGPPRLWLPSQSDQGRREPAQQPHQHGGAEPPARVPQPEHVAPAPAPVPGPAPEQWKPAEQPAVWQQQPPQGASWEGPQPGGQEQPVVWQQADPVAPEPERTFDYPSWYNQPSVDEETAKAEPSSEYPSWYNQPVVPEPGPVVPEPLLSVPEPEPVVPEPVVSEPVVPEPEPEPVVSEPVPEPEPVVPEPVVSEPVVPEPEPEPVVSEPVPEPVVPGPVAPEPLLSVPEPVEPELRQEATHGKSEKSKHAGKGSNRAKPSESRGGRRAKPVDGGEAASPEGGQDAAAVAAALAGAHASGHSVGELLSRLTPDEAAGYHGRRRRSQMSDDEAR